MKNINMRTTVMANRIMVLRLCSALGMDEKMIDNFQDECNAQAEEEVNKMIEEMEGKEENEDTNKETGE